VAPTKEKTNSPFKINLEWLKVEYFVKNIKNFGKPFDEPIRCYAPLQFQKKLKKENKVVSQWEKDKKKIDDRLRKEVEEGLETMYNSEGFGYLIEMLEY
jgi:hypothetical protein